MTARQDLLETAFSDIPSTVGKLSLRPLSAGSFTLLARLGNPMMTGQKSPVHAASETGGEQAEMFAAVIQYIWVHSADIEKVLAIETAADIPATELRALGFAISMGEAFGFLAGYQKSALRMSASLTKVDPEDDDKPGKLQEENLPVGSPPSFSPAVPAATESASDTSSGSRPSNEPSLTSMPPTSQPEPAAYGHATILPLLTVPETATPQS